MVEANDASAAVELALAARSAAHPASAAQQAESGHCTQGSNAEAIDKAQPSSDREPPAKVARDRVHVGALFACSRGCEWHICGGGAQRSACQGHGAAPHRPAATPQQRRFPARFLQLMARQQR